MVKRGYRDLPQDHRRARGSSRSERRLRPQSLPLAGMVVVELGHSVAAPVRRADPRRPRRGRGEGREARRAMTRASGGRPFLDGASPPPSQSINRNKRSVVCELRDRRRSAPAWWTSSSQKADVVLQNLRPGPGRRSWAWMRRRVARAKKPSLVYCNVGAFGAKWTAIRSKPGYDPLMQAFGGDDERGGRGGPAAGARRRRPSSTRAPRMWGTIGILVRTAHRRQATPARAASSTCRCSKPRRAWMVMHAAHYLGSGETPEALRLGRQVGIAPYKRLSARRTATWSWRRETTDCSGSLCGVLGLHAGMPIPDTRRIRIG